MVGGASRVAMFPVALNALTPTSPSGNLQPCLQILGDPPRRCPCGRRTRAPTAWAPRRDPRPDGPRGTSRGPSRRPRSRPRGWSRDPSWTRSPPGRPGLTCPGRRTAGLRQRACTREAPELPRPSTGWARSSAGSRWAGRSWEPREVHLALELVDFIIDGRVADDERARAFPTREPGAPRESRDAHRPRGGEGRDDGRHRREFSRLHVRTRATGVRSRRTTNDVQLAQPSAGPAGH